MRDNTERVTRLKNQITEIEEALKRDASDGYLLRAHVRSRLEDYLETLQDEYEDLVSGYFKNREN